MVYEFFTVQNRRVNNLRGKLGREPVDYCSRMKTRLKAIVKRVTNFDEVLLQQAALGEYDGVICGHIHRPALYTDADGRVYANTGDWVEHCTVIVEHYNGELELLTWAELADELMPEKAPEGQFVI
jgi:UDP-2,3-diacylglucosamine pyrophosphatase LpxH